MAITLTSLPTYPAAGQPVTLIGTADTGVDEDTEFELTSVPNKSKLALGKIVERHPSVVRTQSVSLTYRASSAARKRPASITRSGGSFVAEGYIVGMLVDITGASSANNKRVTVAAVEPLTLTLVEGDTLTNEVVTSSLTGAFFGRSGGFTDTFTPDAAGTYGIKAYEYFTTPGTGGGYAGDPMAAAQRRLLSTTTTSLYVGAYLDLPIEPVSGHGATLRILVVDDSTPRGFVRAAELINPRTDLARMAILDTTVAAAVAALVGVLVTSIDEEFIADVNDICTKYEAHRILTAGGVHASADTTNALLVETANSIPTAIARLNDAAAKIQAHQQATSAGGTWHAADDGRNTLQVAPVARSLGQAIVLKADLRERVYEAHRVQTATPASHGLADSTNTINAALPLTAAIVAYLNFIASPTPDIPTGEPEGVGDAIAAYGFTKG